MPEAKGLEVGKIVVVFEPEGKKIVVKSGATILEAAKNAGVGIRSECGGEGICGKCKVIVKNPLAISELTEAEKRHLSKLEIDSGYRLACQAHIKQSVVIVVPPESRIGERKIQVAGLERYVPLNPLVKKIHVVMAKPTLSDVRPDFERLIDHLRDRNGFEDLEIDYELLKKLPDIIRSKNWAVTVTIWDDRKLIDIEPGDTSNELFGFAVDIGTSKIVGYLVDLTTGKTISIGSIENPQIMHGEDIITRIGFATGSDSNLEVLHKLVINGINQVIHEACRKAKVNPNKIYEATVVGNTAMLHFFLAIQPRYLALSPFVPAIKKSLNIKAKNLGLKINPRGNVHVLPVIAGFVGADAVADVLSTGILESNEVSLLIDIGTNTEVFVGNSEDMITCSCASGPAFEGAHIKHGMKAVTGA
ncbi:MAG: ASKHA domain-containing protein, partial [Candidatus Baldrarchaeia archaeon]